MRKSGLLAGLAVAGLLTTGAYAQPAFGPYQAVNGVVTENFDGMGTTGVVPFDGVAFYHWNVNVDDIMRSPAGISVNGGPDDPNWVSWGDPSVGAKAAYNQGMFNNPDRALGVYTTAVGEFAWMETAIQTDVAGDKVIVTFDLEVPMARFAGALPGTSNYNKASLDVSIDGIFVGNSGVIDTTAPGLTPWNWGDATIHYWLDDAEMDAGGASIRGITMELDGAWDVDDIITIRWTLPTVDSHFRMHTGIDNVTIAVVPEPASLALLGLGGLAMLRRRKA